jgi:hypothetical protein
MVIDKTFVRGISFYFPIPDFPINEGTQQILDRALCRFILYLEFGEIFT